MSDIPDLDALKSESLSNYEENNSDFDDEFEKIFKTEP